MGSLYGGLVRFYLGCDRIKRISSAKFTFDPKEAATFVSYTQKIERDIWQKGHDIGIGAHPRLKTLQHRGKPCWNEVYHVDPQGSIILILAKDSSHLLGFDTKTNALTPHVVWMTKYGEWDTFNVETSKAEMIELVK